MLTTFLIVLGLQLLAALLFSSYGPLWGHIGPFRGWQREGRVRHYLAVENPAVSGYRGDFRVFDVLQRVKAALFSKNLVKKGYIRLPF